MPNATPGDHPAPIEGAGPPSRGRSRRVRAGLGIVGVAVVAVVGGSVLLAGAGGHGEAAAASPSASLVSADSPGPGASGLVASAYPSPSAVPTGSAAPSASVGPSPSVTPSFQASQEPSASPSGPPPSAAPSPSPTIPAKALQARLDKWRKQLHIPGVSVAIVWDDGRQWLGASGYRDVAAKDPMSTGTAFALASVSKTLTAAVILQLVDEGKLTLDTHVAPLLPEFKMDRRITVRMLLDHTSGLPDYFLNAKIDAPLQRAKDATWTAERTWAFVPAKRAIPGHAWAYSNSNYLLLGQLVERITGDSLASQVRRRLLGPLGLDDAWYQAHEKPRAPLTRAYRLVFLSGHRVRAVTVAPASDVMPFRSVVTAADGAGSIAATALDAARWMQAYGRGDLISAGLRTQQLAALATTRALKARIPYGLGIQAIPVLGRYALGHSGRFLGFRNVVRYLPVEGVAIAVLTNQGLQDPARIEESLLRLVLQRRPAPSLSPPVPASAAPSASVSPSASGSPPAAASSAP